MICGLFGLPGCGKTLLLSKIAFDLINGNNVNKNLYVKKHCKDCKKVYTNFPLENAYKLDFEKLGFSYYHDCVIIIDEIQLLADSRNYKNFGENLKFFFSMHRHWNIDIIYASQSYSNCDKKIRDLTDHLYYIDDWYFNIMRVREIIAYFNIVNGCINEGYDFTGAFKTVYFFRKKFYHYADTMYIINDKINKTDEPSDLWFDIDKIGKQADKNSTRSDTLVQNV